jgi:hypothetical protein
MMRKKICIISFSDIEKDARVLRQIKYLSHHYDIGVIGLGRKPDICDNELIIKWIAIKSTKTGEGEGNNLGDKLIRLGSRLKSGDSDSIKSAILLRFGIFAHFSKAFCRICYWANSIHMNAFDQAVRSRWDAYLANDWDSLPIATAAAKIKGSKILFDAHEYSLGQRRDFFYRLYSYPIIRYCLQEYLPKTDAFVTVGPIIGKRYHDEFGISPCIIRNAPDYCHIDLHPMSSSKINIVHHGVASPRRHLEGTIQAIGLSDKKFHLHLMLVQKDPVHLKKLKKMAHDVAPNRIHFHEAVPPSQIVSRISEYDLGICVFPPVTYNLYMTLPNKFFDFIQAGLGVITGPSPEMAAIVKEYNLGKITSTFSPPAIAKTLNALTIKEIECMRRSSRKAAEYIHAKNEHVKLIRIFDNLLGCSSTN